MNASEYYRLLELSEDCSLDDLKRAYRVKARTYHPDLNHSPEAPDIFIRSTEAYVFLINYMQVKNRTGANKEYVKQWEEFRRNQAKERADYYSRIRYKEYTKSNTYRTTRIYDGTIIIYGLATSLLIIVLAIYSYSKGMQMAVKEEDEPSLALLIVLILLGTVFSGLAILNLIPFINKSRLNDKKS